MELHRQCQAAIERCDIEWLAANLSVSVESLQNLEVGHYQPWACFTFPMRDERRRVIGIRTRDPNTNAKRAVPGSKSGLFVPTTPTLPTFQQGEHLFVCEGPTDTAALLTVGFHAIGRPDCCSCKSVLVELVRQLRPPSVIIVADDDEVGLRGAKEASAILTLIVSCSIIIPPSKDVREWAAQGASRNDIELLVRKTRNE